MTAREEFLSGDRPEDVLFYLHDEAVSNPDAFADYAEPVEDGHVLVLPGEDGRSAFQSATGIDPMALAKQAMGTDGDVRHDLTGSTCPAADSDADHTTRFLFAFAEEQNEEVGDLYAEGDVIHAYAVCDCGERYSEKWVVDDA